MSRIHEALQRAYLERGRVPVLPELEIVETEGDPVREMAPAIAVEPVVEHEIVLDEIRREIWKPYMASLPTFSERGAAVEQFRSVRSHIYQARYEAPLKTILVASGIPSEGKSFVAANLAMSLARNSIHNVLLIDADLRRPTLHTILGAPNEGGLADYLEGALSATEILQRERVEKGDANGAATNTNLTFIPSGKQTENSTELVANGRMKKLIETVSPTFDWIVIDGPPVLVVSDGIELSRAADAVLLVARCSRTPYEVVQRTQAAFSSSRLLGFVLNDITDAPHGRSYHYNAGDYYYRSDAESGRSRDDGK